MVIVKLMGGIGNQMFQYAAGRALAHRLKTELKVDIGAFKDNGFRQYQLDIFNIQASIASREEIERLTVARESVGVKFIRNLFHQAAPRPKSHKKEKHFHFDPQTATLSGNVYLNGYWQSERYFKPIKTILFEEFRLKSALQGKNKKLAEQINACRSVSLHIRLGDYVSNPKTNRFHGTCSLDYYQRCVEDVASKGEPAHFFIFSDEPQKVNFIKNLPYKTTIVDHNDPASGYEDMRLMSLCKHNIIANSSFSWWAAWLNQNQGKRVYAPQKWFNHPQKNTKDLYPETWITF
jgi:hypothetical protein